MQQRILKLQLIILFIITLISVAYSLLEGNLPDSSLLITSDNSSFLTFSYYISSVCAEISYFVGPWVLFPFLIFAAVYSFVFSKRSFIGDEFSILALLLACLGFTYIFFPQALGNGVKYFSETFFNIYYIFVLSLMASVLFIYLVLRGGFFLLIKKFSESLDFYKNRIQSNYTKSVKKLDMSRSALKVKKNLNLLSTSATESLRNISKDKKDKLLENVETKPSSVKDVVNKLPTIDTKSDSHELKDESDVVSGKVDELQNKVDDSISNDITTTNSKFTEFFDTKDLISYISANNEHQNNSGPDDSYFKTIIVAIESKLAEFRLDAKIINILKGPVVDTFELELGTGVKVSKVTGLSDDIGLALNGAPIRIVYPMRGKSTIGIEVPRNPRDFIFLEEVLNSDSFNDSKQRLPIAMGRDAFGDVKVVDLAGMPHMLVAGATGAGKSVFINTLLVSLIIKKSPRQLKLVLIDPKQLELALFQELPHLMLPVITDPKSSAVALLWAVQEMERRYTILSKLGVKNIEGFNNKIKTCDTSLLLKINEYYEDEENDGYDLPYIVVVIDEFADLILSKSGKEIETNVNRLAAKARAAGIHLVVATQRPSTDVVTGVVKANFPTRVAFRVSTGHDSKTILDQYGAEKLLGKGDMLYKHGVDLLRLHSSFVEEDEIEGLIEKLATIPKSYNEKAMDFLENGGEEMDDDESISNGNFVSGTSSDPMYQQALEVVTQSGSASASMLQRRLRVGYNRAANLVEELERNGIVGPAQGSKPRKVLARSE